MYGLNVFIAVLKLADNLVCRYVKRSNFFSSNEQYNFLPIKHMDL